MKEELTFEVKDDCFKQGHTPTCAIYSFLNGLFYGEKISKSCINLAANELWDYALNLDENNKVEHELNKYNSKYSVVGEFYDSEWLADFLTKVLENSKKFKNFSKLLNKTNIAQNKIKIINFKDEEDDYDRSIRRFCNELDNDLKGSFYIVPINADNNDTNNMHWICIKNMKILNSAEDYYLSNAAHVEPKRNEFSKNEIVTMYQGIHERGKRLCGCCQNEQNKKKLCCRKKVIFDFNNWAKKRHTFLHKYPTKYGKKLKQIRNLKSCNYDFKNSDFNIIRVDLNSK